MPYYKAYKVEGHSFAFEVASALVCVRYIQDPPRLVHVFSKGAALRSFFPRIFNKFSAQKLQDRACDHLVDAVNMMYMREGGDELKKNRDTLNNSFLKVVDQIGLQASFHDFTLCSKTIYNSNSELLLQSKSEFSSITEWAEKNSNYTLPSVMNAVIGRLDAVAARKETIRERLKQSRSLSNVRR